MLKIYKKSVEQSQLLIKLHQLKSNLGRAITDHLPETFDFLPTGKTRNILILTYVVEIQTYKVAKLIIRIK